MKIIVIGSSGGGKTSLLKRLVDKNFSPNTASTVGVEYFTYDTTIDGHRVRLLLWDTAGQERFYTISKAYFRSALGVILVFDITDRKSFEQIPRWLRDARNDADKDCSAILVGNKTDMESGRVVTAEEAEAFAAQHDLVYVETSVRKNMNVDEVFVRLSRDILARVERGEAVGETRKLTSTRETMERTTQQNASYALLSIILSETSSDRATMPSIL